MDVGGYRDGPNQSFGGSSTVGSPIETGESDFISRRNSILRQGHLGSSSQPLRSVRSISSQRSSRDPRPSSSGLRSLQVGPSEERLPSVADGYSRHPRPLSAIGWRNNDGARRSRVSTERFRSFPDEGSGHDQLEYEVCSHSWGRLICIQGENGLFGLQNMQLIYQID